MYVHIYCLGYLDFFHATPTPFALRAFYDVGSDRSRHPLKQEARGKGILAEAARIAQVRTWYVNMHLSPSTCTYLRILLTREFCSEKLEA